MCYKYRHAIFSRRLMAVILFLFILSAQIADMPEAYLITQLLHLYSTIQGPRLEKHDLNIVRWQCVLCITYKWIATTDISRPPLCEI